MTDSLADRAAIREVVVDSALLTRFPEGYRHLGYLQTKSGFAVKLGLPSMRGPEVAKLHAEGAAWLGGAATAGAPSP